VAVLIYESNKMADPILKITFVNIIGISPENLCIFFCQLTSLSAVAVTVTMQVTVFTKTTDHKFVSKDIIMHFS
jgi:hypothetical protein